MRDPSRRASASPPVSSRSIWRCSYSALIQDLLDRPGALIDDVLLIESAWIFVRDTWTWTDVLNVGILLAVIGWFGTRVTRYLGNVWRWGAGLEARPVAIGWAMINGYCLLSLAWFGVSRDDPIIQLQAKQVYHNWQRSGEVLAAVDAMNSSSVEIARRLAETRPVRRPDIFLFEVESYGATLWADDDYAHARQGLMRRVQSQLDALQLPMFTQPRRYTAEGHG